MSEERVIPHVDRSRLYNVRRQRFITDLNALADQLYRGRITLGMWEEDMRTRMREYMVGCASIGRGGRHLMTSSDWGKVGAELKKQYRWLHGFSKAIYDKRNTVSLGAIKSRARLYADAGAKIANLMQAGPFASMLSWIPGDGSTTCLNGCGCKWILTVQDHDESGVGSLVAAIWTVDPAKENCLPRGGLDGCIDRNGHVEMLTIAPGVEIPPYIGVA